MECDLSMTQAPRTHLHDAVLRARSDNVVIVRTPGDVEDGAFVAADKRMISWDATDLETRHENVYTHGVRRVLASNLVVGQHDEGTAASRLHNDGEKFGIDGAECGVPTALGHSNIVVALLPLHRLSINMTEL